MILIIGQILGLLAGIAGFFAFQQKMQRGIIAFQIATCLIFVLHYLCLGAKTGISLNILIAITSILCFIKNRKEQGGYKEPIIFSILVIIVSICTWEGFHSLFLVIGIIVTLFSLSFKKSQNSRKAMLIKAPLCPVPYFTTLRIRTEWL